eukprot:scaffold36832_cov19-Tisochrysis_lutea.AAC.7
MSVSLGTRQEGRQACTALPSPPKGYFPDGGSPGTRGYPSAAAQQVLVQAQLEGAEFKRAFDLLPPLSSHACFLFFVCIVQMLEVNSLRAGGARGSPWHLLPAAPFGHKRDQWNAPIVSLFPIISNKKMGPWNPVSQNLLPGIPLPVRVTRSDLSRTHPSLSGASSPAATLDPLRSKSMWSPAAFAGGGGLGSLPDCHSPHLHRSQRNCGRPSEHGDDVETDQERGIGAKGGQMDVPKGPLPAKTISGSLPKWKQKVLLGMSYRGMIWSSMLLPCSLWCALRKGCVRKGSVGMIHVNMSTLVCAMYYYILLALTVLYVVFENDIKRAALPIEADLPLEIAVTVILVLYALEMSEYWQGRR